jgi:hypothetical protein
LLLKHDQEGEIKVVKFIVAIGIGISIPWESYFKKSILGPCGVVPPISPNLVPVPKAIPVSAFLQLSPRPNAGSPNYGRYY